MQRGFSLISIIIAVILILVLGGIAYQVISKKNQKVQKLIEENIIPPSQPPQQTPSTDETVYTESDRSANWKTYTNTKLGYSLKYPPEWSLVKLSDEDVEIYDQPNITQPQLHDGKGINIFVLNVRPEMVQISDPIGTKKEIATGVFEEKIGDITLDKQPAAKIIEDVLPGSPTDARLAIFVRTTLGSKILTISFYAPTRDRKVFEKESKIFDQVLSTFKFLK